MIVTGASGHLGRATAKLLGQQGAQVAVCDLEAARVEATVQELAPYGRFHTVPMDVAAVDGVADGVALAIERMGGVDGLVNCAAIVAHGDPLDVPRSDFESTFAVNVFGAYEVARRVARHMIDTGTHGAIVNVASEAGRKGHIDSLAYSASKAALISVNRMLSETLHRHDINVNAVCPGGLETPMLHEVADAYSALTGDTPAQVFEAMKSDQIGRHLQPDEVARTISFLLSDEALLIRGQALNVDAGDTVG